MPNPDAPHSDHYRQLDPEPVDVILVWNLGFLLGQVVKYVGRAGRKDDELTDLRKARWYLDRRIRQLEG